MERQIVSGRYSNAFKCKKCPQAPGPDGCPMWWEVVYTNVQSGEQVLKCGCGYVLLPLFLVENLKSGYQAAETAQRFRNEIAQAFAVALNHTVQRIALNGKTKDMANKKSERGN